MELKEGSSIRKDLFSIDVEDLSIEEIDFYIKLLISVGRAKMKEDKKNE